MYEARQNKEKVSRVDATGGGMRSRIRSKDSHDMKQNTLIPYISMLSKAHIIQCQPPEEKIKVRAFYIWEKNGRKEQTKEEEIKDYLLANDIEICKEKLELDDDDEPEIEIFNPEEKIKKYMLKQ